MTLNLHYNREYLSSLEACATVDMVIYSIWRYESLLVQLHGTSDVSLQILWTLQALKELAVNSEFIRNPSMKSYDYSFTVCRKVKKKKTPRNFKIPGVMEIYKVDDVMKHKLKVSNLTKHPIKKKPTPC